MAKEFAGPRRSRDGKGDLTESEEKEDRQITAVFNTAWMAMNGRLLFKSS